MEVKNIGHQDSVTMGTYDAELKQQLTEAEKQLAISELEKIYNLFKPYENSQKDTILCANNGISFIDYLENQIKSLKGEE